jgi:hypothetical protein
MVLASPLAPRHSAFFQMQDEKTITLPSPCTPASSFSFGLTSFLAFLYTHYRTTFSLSSSCTHIITAILSFSTYSSSFPTSPYTCYTTRTFLHPPSHSPSNTRWCLRVHFYRIVPFRRPSNHIILKKKIHSHPKTNHTYRSPHPHVKAITSHHIPHIIHITHGSKTQNFINYRAVP